MTNVLQKFRDLFNLELKGVSDTVAKGSGDLYSGSTVSDTTADFLGDWRSSDGWQRFDLSRVRARSRQLERGNPWAISFKKSLVNNVLGSAGFKFKMGCETSKAYGDSANGEIDYLANDRIKEARKNFCLAKNFTTRKKLTEREVDRLLLTRLCFDGEFILRRQRKFPNDFNFSWQLINADYLDQNLNRLHTNGNYIKMGVELDATWKFPVAYWFLLKRPNDQLFNYNEVSDTRYTRVLAEDVIHVYVQDLDEEQTRGWPWFFAAAVNLFRMGKYEEAALINAAIGASKMGFFKKTVPDGFIGNPQKDLTDDGEIVEEVSPGMWVELPWNVEPVDWDPKYPDSEFGPFCRAMMRGTSASLGISYASLSQDYSDTNFSSMRPALNEEREEWMGIQQFMIDRWKKPEFEEWLFWSLLTQEIKLPFSKFEKFNSPCFKGRRWPYVSPLEDLQAKMLGVDNLFFSISSVIEESGADAEETFAAIAKDQKLLEKLNLVRVHPTYQFVSKEAEMGRQQETSKPPAPKDPPPAKE